jgi:hypothetical protein
LQWISGRTTEGSRLREGAVYPSLPSSCLAYVLALMYGPIRSSITSSCLRTTRCSNMGHRSLQSSDAYMNLLHMVFSIFWNLISMFHAALETTDNGATFSRFCGIVSRISAQSHVKISLNELTAYPLCYRWLIYCLSCSAARLYWTVSRCKSCV